jgi:hypothetical protein
MKMGDPKGIAALIMSKRAGEPVSPSEEDTDSQSEIESESASEVMEAMQSGDSAKFAEALKSFIQLCMP